MIIGHKQQQKKLKTLFEKEQIPHALLFSGPGSVGKKTVAKRFLKMINCEGQNPPCDYCRNCHEINEKIHADVMEVYPQGKEIHIKQIEEAIERTSYKGIKARFKGIVIDKAHLMNLQAQNALLKTLEEPSKNTVIILVSEYPYSLLSTVLSRVFTFKFFLVPEKEIFQFVKDHEIVKMSFGKPGKAIEYLNSSEKKIGAENEKKEVEKIMEENIAVRLSVIKKVVEEGREEDFLDCWLKAAEEKMINELRKKRKTENYCRVIKEIEEAIFLYSKTNTNSRLLLEKIAVKI